MMRVIASIMYNCEGPKGIPWYKFGRLWREHFFLFETTVAERQKRNFAMSEIRLPRKKSRDRCYYHKS